MKKGTSKSDEKMEEILDAILEDLGGQSGAKMEKVGGVGGGGGPPGRPKKEKKAKKKADKFWHAGLLPEGRGRRIYRRRPTGGPPPTPTKL